jgi:three-Cys-motif partner protein
MKVDWKTLETIAATKSLDVWLLFPIFGAVRQLALLASGLDASKRAALTRILGTDEWFDRFYKPDSEYGMLLDQSPPTVRRTATIDEIENYVRDRLRTIFAHVEPPRRLTAPGNKSLFSLFFAVSNPNAVTLAVKVARHILTTA